MRYISTSTQPDASSGWGLYAVSTMEQQTMYASSDGCLGPEQAELIPWDNPSDDVYKEVRGLTVNFDVS